MIVHNDKKLYTLENHPSFCELCHLTGGYCGHCNGGYFKINYSGFMLVKIDQCGHCDKQGENRSYIISHDEYLQNRKAYDSGVHECTSANTIFGGGACCDVIGHRISKLYE